jgi:hypothetical protein
VTELQCCAVLIALMAPNHMFVYCSLVDVLTFNFQPFTPELRDWVKSTPAHRQLVSGADCCCCCSCSCRQQQQQALSYIPTLHSVALRFVKHSLDRDQLHDVNNPNCSCIVCLAASRPAPSPSRYDMNRDLVLLRASYITQGTVE